MTPPLACTVRECGLFLEQRARTLVCARGHAYDMARSGYINLLQPTDRRSLYAGDSADAIAARARLLDAHVGRGVINAVVERVGQMMSPGDVVVDLGAGSGELLASLKYAPGGQDVTAIGIDISTAAAEHASRRHPGVTWVVANADRRLPLLDRTVDVMLSVHGRRNPGECARALTAAGRLAIAVPAADDLIELRELVQGRGVERDRSASVEQEHARLFRTMERFEVREHHQLGAELLRDLLRGTYRGRRKSVTERVEQLTSLKVTLSSVVTVLERATAA